MLFGLLDLLEQMNNNNNNFTHYISVIFFLNKGAFSRDSSKFDCVRELALRPMMVEMFFLSLPFDSLSGFIWTSWVSSLSLPSSSTGDVHFSVFLFPTSVFPCVVESWGGEGGCLGTSDWKMHPLFKWLTFHRGLKQRGPPLVAFWWGSRLGICTYGGQKSQTLVLSTMLAPHPAVRSGLPRCVCVRGNVRAVPWRPRVRQGVKLSKDFTLQGRVGGGLTWKCHCIEIDSLSRSLYLRSVCFLTWKNLIKVLLHVCLMVVAHSQLWS